MGLNSLVKLIAHHLNLNVMAPCIVVWSFLLTSVCYVGCSCGCWSKTMVHL